MVAQDTVEMKRLEIRGWEANTGLLVCQGLRKLTKAGRFVKRQVHKAAKSVADKTEGAS